MFYREQVSYEEIGWVDYSDDGGVEELRHLNRVKGDYGVLIVLLDDLQDLGEKELGEG